MHPYIIEATEQDILNQKCIRVILPSSQITLFPNESWEFSEEIVDIYMYDTGQNLFDEKPPVNTYLDRSLDFLQGLAREYLNTVIILRSK